MKEYFGLAVVVLALFVALMVIALVMKVASSM